MFKDNNDTDNSKLISTTCLEEREVFITLTNRLLDVLTDFTNLTIRILSKKNGAALSVGQFEEIINQDLVFRVQQIQDQDTYEIIRERIYSEYNPPARD